MGASAEGYAGFGWIFGLWENIGVTLIAATEPVLLAISSSSSALVAASFTIWSMLILTRIAQDGLLRGLLGGMLIFYCVAYGMSPVMVQLPSGSSVRLVQIQAHALNATIAVHKIYRDTLGQVVAAHTVAGSIIPAQAAADDIAERGTQVFRGTDLERLIRDYNASCAPARTELAGEGAAARIDALHAVGLLGGGLGVPDTEISLIEQARSISDGFWTAVFGSNAENGGLYSRLMGGGAALEGMNRALDLSAIRERRAAGIAMLEANNSPFMGTEYVLPTRSHWEGLVSGKEGSASYIPTSKLPDVGYPSAIVNPSSPPIMFRPRNCVEAYKVAQLGAEAAYQAMSLSSETGIGGQRISSEASAVGNVIAWQRLLSGSLKQTTGLSEGGANTAAGTVAVVQAGKDLVAWFDLQTLLPGYVMLSAWIYWLAILVAPIALLLMPIRGIGVLLQWVALLFLPVITIAIAHAVTVSISLVMAAVSIGQAAAASGWAGAGAEFDALRGSMGMLAALILGLVTWISSLMTGVSLAGLAGSLSGAVATTSAVGGAVSGMVGKAVMVSRLTSKSTSTKTGGSGGPGGSGPGASNGGQAVRTSMAHHNNSAANSPRPPARQLVPPRR